MTNRAANGISGRPRQPAAVSRLLGLVTAGAAMSLLLLAASLAPESAGHGTHTQLGLPECGWVMAFGRPCPTCGMTTAVATAARGSIPNAAQIQPGGAAFALFAAVAFWAGLHAAVSGARIGRMFVWLLQPRALWAGAGVIAAAWVYKIATWSGDWSGE